MSIQPFVDECPNKNPNVIGYEDGVSPFARGLKAVADGKPTGSLEKPCDYFMGSASTLQVAATTTYCGKLVVVGKPFYPILTSFAFGVESNLTDLVSEEILKLQQKNQIIDEVRYGVGDTECNYLSDSQIGWNLMSPFIYLSLGILAILFLFVVFYP